MPHVLFLNLSINKISRQILIKLQHSQHNFFLQGDACVEALWAKMVGRNRRPCVSRLIRIIYPHCMVSIANRQAATIERSSENDH